MIRRFALLPLFLLAACGEAAKEIASPAAAVNQAIKGTDAERWCTQLHTARFVRDAYGDLSACRTVQRDREPLLGGMRAGAPRVTGNRASVPLTLEDGSAGKAVLAREGDAWRIDGYDDAFYTALVTFAYNGQLKLTAERRGLNAAGAAACIDDRVGAHPPERVRDIGLAMLGARDTFDDTFMNAILICLGDERSGEGGRSYLRIHLELQLIDELGGDADCVRRRMRSVSDSEIIEHAGRNKDAPPPATERLGKLIERCIDS